MSDDSDEVLRKAEALLAKHRGARTGRQIEPPIDFPTLTEVVEEAPAQGVGGVPMNDEQLLAFERDLRREILQLIRSELERLVEARLHPRLESKVAEVMTRTRIELEIEVRRAVREAVTEVIDDEIARLNQDSP